MDMEQLKKETAKFMSQNKPKLPSNFKGNENVHRAIRDMEKDLNEEGVLQNFQINLRTLFQLRDPENNKSKDPSLGKHGYIYSDYLLEWKARQDNPKMYKLFLTNRVLGQSRTLQTCPGEYFPIMGPLLPIFIEEMFRQKTRI
jgi:hypothetical protein